MLIQKINPSHDSIAFCLRCCTDFYLTDRFATRLHGMSAKLVLGKELSTEDLKCIDYLLEIIISAWERSRTRLQRKHKQVYQVPVNLRQKLQEHDYETFTIELYLLLLADIKEAETLAKSRRGLFRSKGSA